MNILVLDGKAVPVYDVTDRPRLMAFVHSSCVIISYVIKEEEERHIEANTRNDREYRASIVEYQREVDEWNALPWYTRVWRETRWSDRQRRPDAPQRWYRNMDRLMMLYTLDAVMHRIETAFLESETFPTAFVFTDTDRSIQTIAHEVHKWREATNV